MIPTRIVSAIKTAQQSGSGPGMDYVRRCSHFHERSGSIVVFTRSGSGQELSLSFRVPNKLAPLDKLENVFDASKLILNLDLAPFWDTMADEWRDALLPGAREIARKFSAGEIRFYEVRS